MNKDSKLSSVLHVLLHMAHHDAPMTSEQLAACLHTHAVVIRRTLAGLREQGYVCSVKGHGGGWRLCCALDKVSLLDIYQAVGAPPVFAMGHRTDNPACLVEQAVNGALNDAFHEAEALLVKRFGSVTLAELATDFSRRLRQHSRRSS